MEIEVDTKQNDTFAFSDSGKILNFKSTPIPKRHLCIQYLYVCELQVESFSISEHLRAAVGPQTTITLVSFTTFHKKI